METTENIYLHFEHLLNMCKSFLFFYFLYVTIKSILYYVYKQGTYDIYKLIIQRGNALGTF